jgi:ribosomal protein L40E
VADMVYRQTGRTCRNCGSSRLIEGVRLVDQSNGNPNAEIAAVVFQKPEALLFKGAVSSGISAEVCGKCGRIELMAHDPAALLEAVKPAPAPDAVPQETCLECGAHLPAETSACPSCGWTFDVSE